MTKDEALKLALDYIVESNKSSQFWLVPASNLNKTVTAIKEALAQPEQEPVTYTGNGTAGREADVKPTGFFFQADKRQPKQEPVGEVYGWHGHGVGQPLCRFNVTESDMPVGSLLYTTPPSNSLNSIKSSNTLDAQRKPLTDEEIDALAIDEDGLPNSHLEFARAIEAAHGIKE